MISIQQALAAQMGTFMNVFLSTNADFHMAFITTDRDYVQCSNSACWIDSSYSDPTGWAQSVIGGLGINGSPFEMGILMAKRAFENNSTMGLGPQTQFWRDDATLIVVYVSDERDGSSGGWASYFNFFDTLKPDVSLLRQFAVIGDWPSGCIFSSGNVWRNIEFGEGYYEMTQRYNGNWYSICASDWGVQMQDLANTVTTRRIFPIDQPDPIVDSIIVYVNGQVSTSWEYIEANNSIVFEEGSEPEAGQTITIEYGIWGC